MELEVKNLESRESTVEFMDIFYQHLKDLEMYSSSHESQLCLIRMRDKADKMKSNNIVNLKELFRLIDFLKKLPCHIC